MSDTRNTIPTEEIMTANVDTWENEDHGPVVVDVEQTDEHWEVVFMEF